MSKSNVIAKYKAAKSKKELIIKSFWSFYWDLNYKTKWHMAHYVVQKSGHTDGASTSEKKLAIFVTNWVLIAHRDSTVLSRVRQKTEWKIIISSDEHSR